MQVLADIKEKLNEEEGKLTRSAPKEYIKIQNYLMTLRYETDPDYDRIKGQLRAIFERKGYHDGMKLDWEEGGEFEKETQRVSYDNRY